MTGIETQSLDTIADLTLTDSERQKHRIGDLWADNPVVFVWLRHYG